MFWAWRKRGGGFRPKAGLRGVREPGFKGEKEEKEKGEGLYQRMGSGQRIRRAGGSEKGVCVSRVRCEEKKDQYTGFGLSHASKKDGNRWPKPQTSDRALLRKVSKSKEGIKGGRVKRDRWDVSEKRENHHSLCTTGGKQCTTDWRRSKIGKRTIRMCIKKR